MKGLMTFIIIGTLSGCASQYPASSTAHINRLTPDRYEIQLDYFEWVAGGPCNIAFPQRLRGEDWLYVSTTEGTIDAKSIILTHERGKTEYPWPQSALKGSISLSRGSLKVDLQIPYYRQDSTIEKYVPYRLNGTYNLSESQSNIAS